MNSGTFVFAMDARTWIAETEERLSREDPAYTRLGVPEKLQKLQEIFRVEKPQGLTEIDIVKSVIPPAGFSQ